MRIGVMLRAFDEKGGIGVYSRYLTEELLSCDRENDYVLYYRNPANQGRFAHFDNVTERVIKAKSKALWDQIRIPFACRQDRVDVLLHPKFTVPLLATCKTVMVLHGAGWFMPNAEKYWSGPDLRYIKAFMPLYCRKSTAIVSVSRITTEMFEERFKLPPGKVRTVYFGPGKHFKRVHDREQLRKVKQKYDLPDQYVLTLSKAGGGRRKNIEGILQAYQIHHGKTAHKLVVGGKDCDRFRAEYYLPDDGYGQDILFPGWIDQEDLPAVYSLADLYLYPSNVEAFPIPLTEAIACGTPIITSNLNGLKEIAGEAALFVDPTNPPEIAAAMGEVLTDTEVRRSLASKALARSSLFSWEKCAQEMLDILEGLAR
jgi:glycosyltransferase involved in cell wall biosynthesis